MSTTSRRRHPLHVYFLVVPLCEHIDTRCSAEHALPVVWLNCAPHWSWAHGVSHSGWCSSMCVCACVCWRVLQCNLVLCYGEQSGRYTEEANQAPAFLSSQELAPWRSAHQPSPNRRPQLHNGLRRREPVVRSCPGLRPENLSCTPSE